MAATDGADRPFKLAIIGGGIGGLCLAIGLHKHNVPFHLYEQAHAFGEIGAGVAFNGAAQKAMGLIHEDIEHGFKRIATFNLDLKDHWFQFRWGMDGRGANEGCKAGDLLGELVRPNQGLHSVHRAHFLDELVKLLPEHYVSFGHRLTKLEDRGEDVTLHFENGETATVSAAIGCDGIKSHVRDSLLGNEYRAKFSGKYAYRGLLEMDKAAELLGNQMARNGQLHMGYGGHMLHMPIEHGRTMNVVAFRTKDDGKWDSSDWVLPTDHATMEADFKGWGTSVKNILSLMQKADVWALFEHPPAPTFTKNRVALMGDAAHASTPHQGSGAGFAVVDAYVLSDVLSQVKTSAQLPVAIEAYNSVRRQRGLDLVTTSHDTGLMWDFQLPGIEDDISKFKEKLEHHFDWIWNEDLESETTEIRERAQKANL